MEMNWIERNTLLSDYENVLRKGVYRDTSHRHDKLMLAQRNEMNKTLESWKLRVIMSHSMSSGNVITFQFANETYMGWKNNLKIWRSLKLSLIIVIIQ